MTKDLSDSEIIEILTFYATQSNPDKILEMDFPDNKLKYDEKHIRNLLAYSPIFTIEEKEIIIMQLPYLTQDEFASIIEDIETAHQDIDKQLEFFNDDNLDEKQKKAKEQMKQDLKKTKKIKN